MWFAPDNLTQAINPWSWWLGALNHTLNNNNTSLINVNNYKSGNPPLEEKIVRDVAGYGMQLSRIEEALSAGLSLVSIEKLDPAQQENIRKFEEMLTDIRAQKEADKLARLSPGGIDKFIAELQDIKTSDPALYTRVSEQLKEALK